MNEIDKNIPIPAVKKPRAKTKWRLIAEGLEVGDSHLAYSRKDAEKIRWVLDSDCKKGTIRREVHDEHTYFRIWRAK